MKRVQRIGVLISMETERYRLPLEPEMVAITLNRMINGWANYCGKGTKIVAIASGDGLPLAISVESASPAECRLVEAVLAGCFLDELPEKLIGDKAYDSDVLDEQLAQEYGIEMISPDLIASRRRRMDPLRRYRRHWKVERLFAWMQSYLQNYRRLVARCEDRMGNFLGFVQLACLLTLLKHL